MATALDAPLEALDDEERNFVSKIREFGWFGTHVFPEGDLPGFTYSSGFWIDGSAPELIIFGLKPDIMHDILGDAFDERRRGIQRRTGVSIPDLIGNGPVFLFPMSKSHYAEHLGWSRWFYGGDDFPCLQLVWPDRAGIFPWQPGFDEGFRHNQPDLSEKGWLQSLAQ